MISQAILGLDIGHSAIKTTVLRMSLGRFPTFQCRGTRYPIGMEVNDSTKEFKRVFCMLFSSVINFYIIRLLRQCLVSLSYLGC